MRRWFELLMAYQDDLAVLMTTEQGKPLAESRGEIGLRRRAAPWNGTDTWSTIRFYRQRSEGRAGCATVISPRS